MSEKNELREKLCFATKSAAKVFDSAKKEKAFAFAEGYKNFLNKAKTEREAVAFAAKLAEEKGLAEGFANGLAQGMTEGHAKGLAEGHAEGLVQGMTEGHAKGLAEGHAEGLAEGKNEMREDIAMNLLAEGFPVEKVSQLTGLSKEKCSDLKLSAV